MGLPAISHEVAFATSLAVVRVFAPLLRDEEQVDAVREVYELVKSSLLTFAERTSHEHKRLFGPQPGRPNLTLFTEEASTDGPAGGSSD